MSYPDVKRSHKRKEGIIRNGVVVPFKPRDPVSFLCRAGKHGTKCPKLGCACPCH